MENSGALHKTLKGIVGDSGVLTGEAAAGYAFDGYLPKAVVCPESVSDIQAVLRFAAKAGMSVVPAGAGTKLGIGNIPEKVDIVLAMTRLNNVIEYEPADLTVTVEAGLRLAELQSVLARQRQSLVLDPASADRCTLGGIVSANASGARRLRHGTPRNQVLGLRVVRPDGTQVKSGGKVVKNVAGYDLNKLYIGAFGTLGIITEVSLKLAPLPAREAVLTADFHGIRDAVDAGLKVVGSQTLPLFVNLSINGDAPGADKPRLIVGFGGDAETVAWQLTACREIIAGSAPIDTAVIEGEAQQRLEGAIQEFHADTRNPETVIVKLNLKRTDIAGMAERIADSEWAGRPGMMAFLGSGVLYVIVPIGLDADFQAVAGRLTDLREAAVECQGNLIIEAAPPLLKRHVDVWGAVGGTLGLMKRLKTELDPGGLLNPGRFVANL